MKSGKFKRTLAAALALCALCTGAALAEEIVENAVVPLPTPAQQAVIGGADGPTAIYVTEPTPDPYALYADQPDSVAEIASFKDFPMQYPALTDAEAARVPGLLKRYDAGERATQPSVLGVTENVRIGVYALPADQYGGEPVFLILPGEALTDDDLLAIIAAYDALGLRFDPASVTPRCCMRGGSTSSTRSLADDERQRYAALLPLYTRAAVPCPAYDPSPSDDGMGFITLQSDCFSGLERFRFLPARAMTDDELLALIDAEQGRPDASPADLAAYESALIRALHDRLDMPHSAQLTWEEVADDTVYEAWGTGRTVYIAQFKALDGETEWYGRIDTETMALTYATVFGNLPSFIPHVPGNPFDDQYAEIAEAHVRALYPDADIARTELWGEAYSNITGPLAHVVLTDGACYEIQMDYATGTVVSAQYSDAVRCAAMDAYYSEAYGMADQ